MLQSTRSDLPYRTFDPAPIALDAPVTLGPPAADAPANVPSRGDGVSRPWWLPATAGSDVTGAAFPGGIYAVVNAIVAGIGQLVAKMFHEGGLEGGAQQYALDATLSSTGDPHLAETGTVAGTNGAANVDAHLDSMTAHDDLVHSTDVPGGYRVSTTVTQPSANGITWNRSATVHGNYDTDRVTLNADGSIAVGEGGRSVAIANGQTVALDGGETVTQNADGSLVVAAGDGFGGTIATTLRATGAGVDVTTRVKQIGVGGDIASVGMGEVA